MENGTKKDLIPCITSTGKATVLVDVDWINGSSLEIKPMDMERSQAYEWTSRINREDKQTGNYQRYTIKEKTSRDEQHLEKRNGKVGVQDEFKTSSTIKIGNKSGYTEYHTEKRVRDVRFDKSSNSNSNSNSSINYDPKRCLTGDDSDNDQYCGYGYGYGYGYCSSSYDDDY